MYAQMAIASQMNPSDAEIPSILDRFRMMQSIREESGCVDEYQQGCQLIDKLIRDLTFGSYLAFSYHVEEEAYVVTCDMTTFDMKVLSDPDKFKAWLASTYYLFHAFSPDFKATRNGLIILAECEGYHWKGAGMVQTKAFRKWWEDMALQYPLYVQRLKYFHSGLFLNLLLSTAKRFLPRHVQHRMEIGCQSEAGRLDTIFLQPTAEISAKRLVGRFQETLRQFYNNQESFAL